MGKYFYISLFLLLTLFTSSFSTVIVSLPQAEGELAAIANPKGAPSELTAVKLKNILKGEQQRWKDGTKITIALMKTTTPIGESMTKKIFKMTGKDLNKYFLGQVFQGKMSSPEFFETEEALIAFVKSKEGAIGIISSKNSNGLTVISIDGKKSL
jgi:ABC-type phosphate transport system substrate-binding protein